MVVLLLFKICNTSCLSVVRYSERESVSVEMCTFSEYNLSLFRWCFFPVLYSGLTLILCIRHIMHRRYANSAHVWTKTSEYVSQKMKLRRWDGEKERTQRSTQFSIFTKCQTIPRKISQLHTCKFTNINLISILKMFAQKKMGKQMSKRIKPRLVFVLIRCIMFVHRYIYAFILY